MQIAGINFSAAVREVQHDLAGEDILHRAALRDAHISARADAGALHRDEIRRGGGTEGGCGKDCNNGSVVEAHGSSLFVSGCAVVPSGTPA